MTAKKKRENETRPGRTDGEDASRDGRESIGGMSDEPMVERTGETDEITTELDELREEIDEANRKWLRALADLDNYRKRVEREKARWDVEAREGILLPLLEVLDNFERALEGDAPEGAPDDVPFREGVELIFKHLMDVLEKAGVREVLAEGAEFDPNVHEAVGSVASPDHGPNEIIEVMQKGYMLGERLLRPSRVIVAS